MNVADVFDDLSDSDEYLEFDRIPDSEKRHPRPDLCALLYLHERFGGAGYAVTGNDHDAAYLNWNGSEPGWTEADVVYLQRCGVHFERESDCLAMFT